MIKNQQYEINLFTWFSKEEEKTKGMSMFLEKTVALTKKTIQPQSEIQKNCAIMMTNIWAQPEWITIPCQEKIPAFVICQNINNIRKWHFKGKNQVQNKTALQTCQHTQLFIKDRCILLTKHNKYVNLSELTCASCDKVSLQMMTPRKNIMETLFEYFTHIQYFYIEPIQFSIFIHSNNTYLLFKTLQTPNFIQLTWSNEISGEPISEYNGYIFSVKNPFKIQIPSNVFKCNDGSYIDGTSICDSIIDCTNGIDETRCFCSYTGYLSHTTCKYFCHNTTEDCSCSSFYFTCLSSFKCIPYVKVCDGHTDCLQGEDEFCETQSGKATGIIGNGSLALMFLCSESNITISNFLVNDLVPDCPNTIEDEMQYYNLLTNPFHIHLFCNSSHELPCIPGHSHCFQLDKLCVFEFQYNTTVLKHCRNGAHLYNCTNVQCSGYFKCPMAYCIPFNFICNGKWDCPHGEDETYCHSFSCPNLFKCKNQTKCLHLSMICDKHRDCILGDDESWCTNESLLVCPRKCSCLSQSIICKDLDKITKNQIWASLKYFKCFSCTLQLTSNIFFRLQAIRILNIKNYIFSLICPNTDGTKSILFSLNHLDVSSNKLTSTRRFCFFSLQSLIICHLQHNLISNVEDNSFYSLSSLQLLDLSYNKISKLKSMSFHGLINIKTINLAFNLIVYVAEDTFREIPQNTVHSTIVKVCCIAGLWSKCKVNDSAFSSCDDLLSNKFMKYFCWFIGVLAFCLNTVSFLLCFKDNNSVHLVLIDWFLAVYLLIISSANYYYQGRYVGYELAWRNSFTCKLASLFALISMMTSPIILCNIMVARYCVTKWPFASKFRNKIYIKRLTGVSIFIVTCVCILLFSGIFGITKNHVQTSVCLILYTSKDQSIPTLLTSLAVIFVQIICFLIILTLSILLILTLLRFKSGTCLQNSNIKSKRITIKLLILVVTNVCCWIPSSIVFALPIVEYKISNHLLGWITVVAVPINATLDPLLFTILSPEMKKRFLKLCNTGVMKPTATV